MRVISPILPPRAAHPRMPSATFARGKEGLLNLVIVIVFREKLFWGKVRDVRLLIDGQIRLRAQRLVRVFLKFSRNSCTSLASLMITSDSGSRISFGSLITTRLPSRRRCVRARRQSSNSPEHSGARPIPRPPGNCLQL